MTNNNDVVRGRAEIAYRLGRSERTVSRWIARGLLPVRKNGPFENGILEARAADLDRLAVSPRRDGP